MDVDTKSAGQTEAHAIEEFAALSPNQIVVLKRSWITTVDAFVAAAATPKSRAGLCKALSIDVPELDGILNAARELLGRRRYQELAKPSPGGPTGALWEEAEEESKRYKPRFRPEVR